MTGTTGRPGRIAAGLALALGLAACAQGASIAPDRVESGTVGPGYVIGGGDWDTGGSITVAASAVEQNGATVVCGAWATDRQSAVTLELNDRIVAAGSVLAGGRRLVQNLGFMPRAASPEALAGASAGCVATGVPWQPGFAGTVAIALPRQSFLIDEEFGVRATFRQGPRPDVLR